MILLTQPNRALASEMGWVTSYLLFPHVQSATGSFLTQVNCFFSSGYSLSYPRHQARKVNTWQRHNRQNGLDLCLKHGVSSSL